MGRQTATIATITFTNNDSFIHQIYVSGLFDSEEKAPGHEVYCHFPAPRAGVTAVIQTGSRKAA